MYWIKRKIWQIKNIIKWIPVLWEQYDFDYKYAIDVFKFQLSKTADLLESDRAWTDSAKINAQRIRTIIKLMDKVYDEEYGCEYQQKLEDKYGKEIFDFVFIPCPDKEGFSQLKQNYEFLPNAEEIEKDKNGMFNESQLKQEKAHRILWKMVEKDIQRFWD